MENLNDELFNLIHQKEILRKFLLKYKENFEQKNGTMMTATRDLAPILSEFNQYISLKEKIKNLSERLKKFEIN